MAAPAECWPSVRSDDVMMTADLACVGAQGASGEPDVRSRLGGTVWCCDEVCGWLLDRGWCEFSGFR